MRRIIRQGYLGQGKNSQIKGPQSVINPKPPSLCFRGLL
nr:MAG TPA: hypothetical protein [Caudoviricetes sp.]